MIALDSAKILAAKDEDERGEIIAENIKILFRDHPSEEVFLGLLTSLVQNQMITMQYANYLCAYLCQLSEKTGLPFSPINFADWIESKDMSPDELKAWQEKKHVEFLQNRPRIIT